MFAYNQLSDLTNGDLVTPLKKLEDDTILCLNSNDEEVSYTFDDFDFDKEVSDRTTKVEDTSTDESSSEIEEDNTANSRWLSNADKISILDMIGVTAKNLKNINIVKF